MTKDITWKAFEKTGDLSTYLLFKEIEAIKSSDSLEENAGKESVGIGVKYEST